MRWLERRMNAGADRRPCRDLRRQLKLTVTMACAESRRHGLGAAHGALWVAVNERDGRGSDMVPDYMTALREGAFYGWPYSYFGSILDMEVEPQRPDLARTAVVPDYALGAHTSALGLAHSEGSKLPGRFGGPGMFVGQHGSWNRRPRSGFKVVFVPFENGRPSGMPFDVLSGFVRGNGDALGRPVGVAIDRRGGLLVADDVGNAVWRVSAAGQP